MYPYYLPLLFVSLLGACSASPYHDQATDRPYGVTENASRIEPQSEREPDNMSKFVVIAHRGASGFLPEHTKEAAVLSFMQGAHYIEQDLVATKDQQLVVLHDIHLEAVTNVEEVFSERKREDGRYYAIDFTLDELRRLRIHERQRPDRQAVFESRYQGNAHFTVATFAEHVELIGELNRAFDKNVGLYPEIKAAAWHQNEGVDITALVVDALNTFKLNQNDANIYVQSFEPEVLKRLREEFSVQVKLVQLIAENDWANASADYDHMRSQDGLIEVAKYADAIGPYLPQLIDLNTKQFTSLGARANALGLDVHAYTFRTDVIDKQMLPEDAFALIKQSGIQGVFTDQVMPYMFD